MYIMQNNQEQGRNICILHAIHHIVVISFLVGTTYACVQRTFRYCPTTTDK
jgi:hypothetical protein